MSRIREGHVRPDRRSGLVAVLIVLVPTLTASAGAALTTRTVASVLLEFVHVATSEQREALLEVFEDPDAPVADRTLARALSRVNHTPDPADLPELRSLMTDCSQSPLLQTLARVIHGLEHAPASDEKLIIRTLLRGNDERPLAAMSPSSTAVAGAGVQEVSRRSGGPQLTHGAITELSAISVTSDFRFVGREVAFRDVLIHRIERYGFWISRPGIRDQVFVVPAEGSLISPRTGDIVSVHGEIRQMTDRLRQMLYLGDAWDEHIFVRAFTVRPTGLWRRTAEDGSPGVEKRRQR